ncbi:hypothetical protein [Candidatus Pantoea multigeneris]|uniref:Uncharacterized protein n=1 Tax=Candidatus Pantoea multigeneris TaxID=2608357 RepID=A0ABX0RA60_9GAMM|nr:hypothetical protein [Pantoea multigeneris]NIF20354.1 hypothetical protein [Pantoea multigeneris]
MSKVSCHLDNQQFLPLYVPFSVLPFAEAKSVWRNPACPPPWPDDSIENDRVMDEKMAVYWGIATPDEAIFQRHAFKEVEGEVAWAEAYGGSLIGANGGGGRVGIFRGVQIKGIGKTPMVGKDTNIQHSYGALLLEQALTEALYSNLVQQILPYGCAQVHGVIATGVRIRFNDPVMRNWRENADAALLLRQPCLRPAHFLRAEFYIPWKHQPELMDDTQRIRQLYQELSSLSRGHLAFEQMLFNFLARCASQFAVARSSRLIHGTLSPSNLTMDGRWLDLMSTSILPTGANFKPAPDSPAFFAEYQMPLEIALEMVYLYNKINDSKVDAGQFMTFYEHQWKQQKLAASLEMLGLTPGVLRQYKSHFASLYTIAAATERVLTLDKKIRSGWAEVDTRDNNDCEYANPDNDRLWQLLCGLYGVISHSLSGEFNQLLTAEWDECQKLAQGTSDYSYSAMKISRFLRAGKRLLFSPCFYRTRIDNQARHYAEADLSEAKLWLDEQLHTINTIYEKNAETVTLVALPTLRLIYQLKDEWYQLYLDNKFIRTDNTEDLVKVLIQACPDGLVQHGYDFLPGCLALLRAAGRIS